MIIVSHTFVAMHRLLGTVFFLLYSVQTLLCPLQDMSVLKCLPQIYSQCKTEDPDIDAADFVFEHLMNLDCIMSCFDADRNEDKNEKPHHPFQQLQSISQTLVIVNRPLYIEDKQPPFSFYAKKVYPVRKGDFFPADFLAEVFRPPAV